MGGVPYFGVVTIRILLIRVPYLGPLFSETPILMAIASGPENFAQNGPDVPNVRRKLSGRPRWSVATWVWASVFRAPLRDLGFRVYACLGFRV